MSYEAGTIADLNILTPTEGATTAPEINDALREIKRALMNDFIDVPYLSKGYAAERTACISWKDADEIYIPGNAVECDGKNCFWESQLTFMAGSGGSNAASDNLGNNQFHYVYIDHSSVTSRTALTAANFLNDTTAPAYNNAKCGYYNGSDRCVGLFLTSAAGAILAFTWDRHSSAYKYKTNILELDAGTATTATDVDLTSSVPNFGEMEILLEFLLYETTYGQLSAKLHLGKNGDSQFSKFFEELVGGGSPATAYYMSQAMIRTDIAQIIEYYLQDGSSAIKVTLWTRGFYFSI